MKFDCENCKNCEVNPGYGDSFCITEEAGKLVMSDCVPTKDFMWCGGRLFEWTGRWKMDKETCYFCIKCNECGREERMDRWYDIREGCKDCFTPDIEKQIGGEE